MKKVLYQFTIPLRPFNSTFLISQFQSAKSAVVFSLLCSVLLLSSCEAVEAYTDSAKASQQLQNGDIGGYMSTLQQSQKREDRKRTLDKWEQEKNLEREEREQDRLERQKDLEAELKIRELEQASLKGSR